MINYHDISFINIHLRTNVNLHYLHIISSYCTVNTVNFHSKKKCIILYREINVLHFRCHKDTKYWSNMQSFSLEQGGTYSNHRSWIRLLSSKIYLLQLIHIHDTRSFIPVFAELAMLRCAELHLILSANSRRWWWFLARLN
jgi:hypothetical protein